MPPQPAPLKSGALYVGTRSTVRDVPETLFWLLSPNRFPFHPGAVLIARCVYPDKYLLLDLKACFKTSHVHYIFFKCVLMRSQLSRQLLVDV